MELFISVIIVIGFGSAITSRLAEEHRRNKQREARNASRTNDSVWNRSKR